SELRPWSPRKYFLSLRYIWPALTRIIRRAGFMDKARACAGDFHDQRCKFLDREFLRIADIDRSGDKVRRGHEAHEPIDQVMHVRERACLQAIAEDRDVAPEQRLNDEIRHHTPVVRVHARPIGVENPGDFDLQTVLAPIVKEQGFRTALTLVVAGPWANWI